MPIFDAVQSSRIVLTKLHGHSYATYRATSITTKLYPAYLYNTISRDT
jgi:hypothetical protein